MVRIQTKTNFESVKPPLLVKPVTNWNEHMSMFVEEPGVRAEKRVH